jgi:AmpE protein
MTFLVIFSCLAAERFLLHYQFLRRAHWFERWLELHQSLPVSHGLREGRAGLILLLLPPLLAVTLLQTLFDGLLLGIPGILFAALVLLYSLGPEDLDSQIAEWVEAGGPDDPAKTGAFAAELLEKRMDVGDPDLGRELADGVLSAALQRSFAILFWFLVLGPVGALGYRLTREARGLAQEQGRHGLGEPIRALLFLLDWLPARMLVGLFALGGCFEPAVQGWKHCEPAPDLDANASLVICAGAGALQLSAPSGGDTGDQATTRVEAAMALVWRSLVIFVALLGLATISGWLL